MISAILEQIATYYFDDIKLVQSDSEVFESFEDFEGAVPIFTEFGNIGSTQVISNPNPGGINNTTILHS